MDLHIFSFFVGLLKLKKTRLPRVVRRNKFRNNLIPKYAKDLKAKITAHPIERGTLNGIEMVAIVARNRSNAVTAYRCIRRDDFLTLHTLYFVVRRITLAAGIEKTFQDIRI